MKKKVQMSQDELDKLKSEADELTTLELEVDECETTFGSVRGSDQGWKSRKISCTNARLKNEISTKFVHETRTDF